MRTKIKKVKLHPALVFLLLTFIVMIISSVGGILNDNCGVLILKGSEGNVVQNMHIESKLTAPVSKGQKVGSVEYSLDGKIIKTVDIISDREIKKESVMNVASFIFEKWFCLLR